MNPLATATRPPAPGGRAGRDPWDVTIASPAATGRTKAVTMADDPTITWRLDRIEETLRDLGQKVVSADLYARDRAELERDVAELRAQLAEEKLARQAAVESERLARKEADRELKTEITGQGTNWRQAVYAGAIPGLLFLLTLLWQLKGGT